jgi:phosphate transport system substrate-binding protein
MKRFLLLLAFLGSTGLCLAQQPGIRIRGEDTLILVAQRLAQFYEHDHPGTAPRFDIAGGGASHGLRQLARGEADIVQTKNSNGASDSKHLRVAVATESIVVYVHESNPITQISIPDLQAIYTGKIISWKQLGGPDKPILRYAGDSTSGTIEYFQEAILKGEEPYAYWGKNTSKEMLDTIAQQPNAIGFAGLHPRPGVRALRIRKTASAEAVEPTIDAIRTRKYPITRPVYWYISANRNGVLADFCTWVYSSHGQLVMDSVGFYPLMQEDRLRWIASLTSPR